MRVKMLAERRVAVNRLSTKIYRLGSTPDLDAETAAMFIADGVAEAVEPKPAAFTAEQTAILAAAADDIARAREAELSASAGEADAAATADEEVDLTTKTAAELREIADRLGVGYTTKTSRATLIDRIVAAATAAAGA